MRSNIRLLSQVTTLIIVCAITNRSPVLGANAYPLFTDPNIGGLAFGVTDIFSFGANYSVNDGAQLNGNAILSIGQFGQVTGGTGAGLSVPVSNGENGINESFDGAQNQDLNPDVPNMTAANSVFSTIGNASGKLENGNVIRYSAWFRSDPANPLTVDPQIQPVLKFEFWKEALSTNQDTNGGQLQPFFGDKVFDQDQHGGALGIPVVDKAQWIDFNGDGVVIDGAAQGENRVSQISTTAWTLVESMYTVNDQDWLGIADDPYQVDDIEEIRAVMFLGDFANSNLTGDGNGGNLLIDNVLVEVFKDAASVTANTNPDPALPVGLPGDYNDNQTVDAADYVAWRNNPAAFGGDPAGYNTWQANFGRTSVPGGAAGGTTVPEPAAALIVFALVAGGLARIRNN
jgi:hypothetical protein